MIKKMVVLFGMCLTFTAHIHCSESNAQRLEVKVLLHESSVPGSFCTLTGENGFLITQEVGRTPTYINDKTLHVTILENHIIINNKHMFIDKLFIEPVKGPIEFNTMFFPGTMVVLANSSSKKLINCVELEEYVACVLRKENWAGWPLEINKIAAIASRTYVMSRVRHTDSSGRSYHVKNTNADQVYQGGTPSKTIIKAVEATKNMILVYNNEPILAMFDGSCGGAIPAKTAHMPHIDFEKKPYLARTHICSYCKNTIRYEWTAQFTKKELEEIFKRKFPNFTNFSNLSITEKDNAGMARAVTVKTKNNTYMLTAREAFSLLKPKIKSFYYTIEKNGESFTIHGFGFGHHLGLCQWGAKEMTDQGFNYQQVLAFYYPGAQIKLLPDLNTQ